MNALTYDCPHLDINNTYSVSSECNVFKTLDRERVKNGNVKANYSLFGLVPEEVWQICAKRCMIFIPSKSYMTVPLTPCLHFFWTSMSMNLPIVHNYWIWIKKRKAKQFLTDTTRIPEMLGRFLNLNKMKTKRISKSHEPIFYSQ